jgi:hypothetical protein
VAAVTPPYFLATKLVAFADELVDLVDWHIDPREGAHCVRVIASLKALAEG